LIGYPFSIKFAVMVANGDCRERSQARGKYDSGRRAVGGRLHRGWCLGCGVGGSGHPRSQTSHCVILNIFIVKGLNLRGGIQKNLRYCFLNIVQTIHRLDFRLVQ
jgi:hypothetical protein